MTCFYGYSGKAWGMKGSGDTKAGSCVSRGEPRLNGPASTITEGFLQNHCHYCTNTHLGSSCEAVIGNRKKTSSRHTSRVEFQQTAVRPASSTPNCATFVSELLWSLQFITCVFLWVRKSFISRVWSVSGSKVTNRFPPSLNTRK